MSDQPKIPPRKPWVGSAFRSNKNGLLIVGESHVWNQEDRDNPEMTNITIESVIRGKKIGFFTRIEAAVRGVASENVQPEHFWHQHAFANFCQGAFPEDGTRPPSMVAEMFQRGVDTFPTILRDVNPKRMLVFSAEVWNRFDEWDPIRWYGKRRISHEGRRFDSGYLTDVDGQFHVYCTWLPSASAPDWGRPTRWTPLVREFLSRDLEPPPTS